MGERARVHVSQGVEKGGWGRRAGWSTGRLPGCVLWLRRSHHHLGALWHITSPSFPCYSPKLSKGAPLTFRPFFMPSLPYQCTFAPGTLYAAAMVASAAANAQQANEGVCVGGTSMSSAVWALFFGRGCAWQFHVHACWRAPIRTPSSSSASPSRFSMMEVWQLREVSPKGQPSTARTWFSNWLVRQQSMV